jgi:hypothetical protein
MVGRQKKTIEQELADMARWAEQAWRMAVQFTVFAVGVGLRGLAVLVAFALSGAAGVSALVSAGQYGTWLYAVGAVCLMASLLCGYVSYRKVEDILHAFATKRAEAENAEMARFASERERPERERREREEREQQERERAEEANARALATVQQQEAWQRAEAQRQTRADYEEELRTKGKEADLAVKVVRLKERTVALEAQGFHLERAYNREAERKEEAGYARSRQERMDDLQERQALVRLWGQEVQLLDKRAALDERKAEAERAAPERDRQRQLKTRKMELEVKMAAWRAVRERDRVDLQSERWAAKEQEMEQAQAEYEAVQREIDEIRSRAGWEAEDAEQGGEDAEPNGTDAPNTPGPLAPVRDDM